MKPLFWTLSVFDPFLRALTQTGKKFRDSFGAIDINTWFIFILMSSVVLGFLLHFVFKKIDWALVVLALPLVVVFLWLFIEKISNKT